MVKRLRFQLQNYPGKFLSMIRQGSLSSLEYLQNWAASKLGGAYLEFEGYWKAYGGFFAIASSPVFWTSVVLTILFSPIWWNDKWADVAISVLPNLLGFTLGAMAVVLAFPGSKVFRIIAEGGSENSYYISLAARFVHFIFVQVAAIILALAGKAYTFKPLAFIGTISLVYAVLCAAMTALALFGVAQINNHPGALSLLDDDETKN